MSGGGILLHALHQHKIDIYLVNADIPNNISFFINGI